MISVASFIVQEIRSLHDIAVEAFLTSATGPVDVDKELASITTSAVIDCAPYRFRRRRSVVSVRAGIDERMDKLVAKSGRDVEGSSNIKSSTDEIHQAEVARSSALAEVRGDYLNALLP